MERALYTNTALSGDTSGLDPASEVSGIYGECDSGLTGVVSRFLIGDIRGLTGDCTGIYGYIDDCKLTNEDRDMGVNISDLIHA